MFLRTVGNAGQLVGYSGYSRGSSENRTCRNLGPTELLFRGPIAAPTPMLFLRDLTFCLQSALFCSPSYLSWLAFPRDMEGRQHDLTDA